MSNKMKTKTKIFHISLLACAFLIAVTAIFTVAQAFLGPTQDPSTAGFRSPCGQSMSKDDNCTYDRATDSLEAIADKVGTMTP